MPGCRASEGFWPKAGRPSPVETGKPKPVGLDSSCSRANMSVTRPGTTTSNPPDFVAPVELMSLIVQ